MLSEHERNHGLGMLRSIKGYTDPRVRGVRFEGSCGSGVRGFVGFMGFKGLQSCRGSRVSLVREFAGSRVRGVRGFAVFAGSRARGFAGVRGFAGPRVRRFAGSRGSREYRYYVHECFRQALNPNPKTLKS